MAVASTVRPAFRDPELPDAPPELTPERLAEAFAYGTAERDDAVMPAKL